MTIQQQTQMETLRQFFEDLSVEWDDRQPTGRDQLLHDLLAPYDPFFSQCRSILEVGTGTGALIPILRQRYPETNFVSLDIAHHMLTKAGKRQPDACLIQADIHHLPLAAGQFDGL
ncbi:MAG: class I SAM-dependent methyltransferase, partial [Anaerolineaceae bacterium]|nr:class I SAM-dependent methyltransferase [Anaerolineaceae bacterium]